MRLSKKRQPDEAASKPSTIGPSSTAATLSASAKKRAVKTSIVQDALCDQEVALAYERCIGGSVSTRSQKSAGNSKPTCSSFGILAGGGYRSRRPCEPVAKQLTVGDNAHFVPLAIDDSPIRPDSDTPPLKHSYHTRQTGSSTRRMDDFSREF